MSTSTEGRKRQGFASLSKERIREIARLGGKEAHRLKRAHTFSPEEAQAAGRKGGSISRRGRSKKES